MAVFVSRVVHSLCPARPAAASMGRAGHGPWACVSDIGNSIWAQDPAQCLHLHVLSWNNWGGFKMASSHHLVSFCFSKHRKYLSIKILKRINYHHHQVKLPGASLSSTCPSPLPFQWRIYHLCTILVLWSSKALLKSIHLVSKALFLLVPTSTAVVFIRFLPLGLML